MSVNSVSTGLLPFYGPISDNGSQSTKSVAGAKEFPEKARIDADASQATGAEVDGVTEDSSGSSGSAPQFQSALEQTLRQGAATAPNATRETSEPLNGQPSPGIATYQRVSQYGNNEPSTSALLKRWNSIVQNGKAADGAAADFARLLSQNEAPGLEPGILDLTA